MNKKLFDAFASLGKSVLSAVPKVVAGVILIVLGLAFAKMVEVVLRSVLIRMRFDSLLGKVGIDTTLQRIGLRQPLSVLLPKLAYFLVIVVLAQTASDAFGLVAVSSAIAAFFAYLPNIVAALLLVILGTTVGQFAGQMVTQAAESTGIDSAPALGKLVSALIIFIVSMMALGQLKIDTDMVRIVTSFFLGAGALAFGLAFGMGTRDIVRNIVTGFYTRKVLTVGKSLEIGGFNGVLTAITATHTILNDEGQDIIVANGAFLTEISKHR